MLVLITDYPNKSSLLSCQWEETVAVGFFIPNQSKKKSCLYLNNRILYTCLIF